MVSTQKKCLLLCLLALLLSLSVSAVPQNTTHDDSDKVRISYWTDADWSHDPLQGYEQFFVNGTRSFTYVPGAAAFFNFTGTGIYLQGPYSNDQAQRSVTLDGQDMGTFTAYAPERLPSQGTSSVFWGKGGLENTLHIVAVMHADTAEKILVMDAWIFEADSSQSQGAGTNTAVTVASTPSSTSMTAQITDNNGSPVMAAEGIIIGIGVPLALLLLCSAGYCLFTRRLQRNQQRQLSATKEKIIPFSRNTMRLSQPVNLTSATPGPAPSHRRSAPITPAPEYSLGESSYGLAAAAAVTGPQGGAALLSHPFHRHAPSDAYNNEDTLGLSNHPLFSPTPSPAPASTDSHYPTPLPNAGAPMLFFEQRPNPIPPINSDYTQQPIVNAPVPPSVFHRFSETVAGVIPGLLYRASSRNSNAGKGRDSRESILANFRYNTTTSPGVSNNLGPDVERAASPRSRDSDAYAPYASLPYLPSSNSLSNPLLPTSTAPIGFARQSANLEKLGDVQYETSNLSTADALVTLAAAATPGSDVKGVGDRGSETNPFDDENPFSSLTWLKRDEIIRSRPVSAASASNPQ